MIYIQNIDFKSAGGNSINTLWKGLNSKVDFSSTLSEWAWPEHASHFWELLSPKCQPSAYFCFENLSTEQLVRNYIKDSKEKIELKGKKTGLILSSTKGNIEDWVWKNEPQDPYLGILKYVADELEIPFAQTTYVSNACASSHAAIFLAKNWLENRRFDDVLILAFDKVGPFTLTGFQSLRALSHTRVRPFCEKRDGLKLGEAIGFLHLSQRPSKFEIDSIAIDNEGVAATRPSETGESLFRAVAKCNYTDSDFIVAHGTATKTNDKIEVDVLRRVFEGEPSPKLLSTKWSIGHTLGASGLADLSVATKVLETNSHFEIGNIENPMPEVLPFLNAQPCKYKKGLITSLGFGGTHAALTVRGL